MPRCLKIADECAPFFPAYLLLSLICSSLCSHNLEYDSSEEKNPRLIFYNEKDEVVKVSCKFRDLLLICLVIGLIVGAAECQFHAGTFYDCCSWYQILCQMPSQEIKRLTERMR